MINKNILLIGLLCIGTITSTYAQEVHTTPQEISKYNARRSPALAAGLSLITFGFGGGQYYNKQYVKAGIVSAINAGTIIWLIASSNENKEGFDGLGEALGELLIAGIIITANWAYSVIDAPISAATINRRYGLDRKVTITPAFERNTWNARAVNVGVKLTWSLD